MARDYGTMTCDYDHDCFGQGLKFQHSRENGHSYGQKVPSSHRPAVKKTIKQPTLQHKSLFLPPNHPL